MLLRMRVVEQKSMLGDDADLAAQRLHRKIANIDAVDSNPAGSDIVEARDQVGQSAFADAAHPHQRDHFAGVDGEIDIFQTGVLP